ncbi:hypothetical protein HY771_01380 [Candidatus Uhrbacteria bacterium]|nr:hypothetical protein [Candidatus Uhrbacteria bacterium]
MEKFIMKTSFQIPSADPSQLYGRVFPKELRDALFALAVKVLELDQSFKRDDFVGNEYYVLRTVEAIGEKLIADAVTAESAGIGHARAWCDWVDFAEMVDSKSYFQRAYVPSAADKAATEPRTTPKPVAKPSLSVPIGDQLGEAKLAELNAQVTGVTPAPATAAEPAAKKVRRPAKQAAEPEAQAEPETQAEPEAIQAVG